MRLGLCVYGTVYTMGIMPQSGRPLIKPKDLLDQAKASGLSGVEMPVNIIRQEDIEAVAAYARDNGMFITVASGGYHPQPLKDAVDVAKQVGAKTVRTCVGGADFGGDRRKLAGRWQAFLQEVLTGLREAARYAEQNQINLAVENHQDLASEELIWLCKEIDSPYFGIVLDTGNPLATAEEPIEFAERISPYLKNVHLKDYTVHLSEEGYQLVRCPLGQGVVDFPALFELLAERCPDVTMSVELGSLNARHTRVLAEDYWPDYPVRSAAQLAKVLRFVNAHAKPVGDFRTPHEKGEPPEAVIRYETHQLQAALAYIVPLFQAMQEGKAVHAD